MGLDLSFTINKATIPELAAESLRDSSSKGRILKVVMSMSTSPFAASFHTPSLRDRFILIAVFVSCLLLWSSISAGQSDSPQLRGLLQNGNAALDAGDFRKAAEQFEGARALAPDSVEVSRGLLEAYLQLGRPDLALPIGTQAAQKAPKDARIHHLLGLAYFKTQQNEPARQELEKSANLDPNNADVPFDLALVFLNAEQYDAASQQLEKSIKLSPRNPLAHVLLGRALLN